MAVELMGGFLGPRGERAFNNFEIGYDRDYTGTALHCRLCPSEDLSWSSLIVLDDAHDVSLTALIEAAYAHWREKHEPVG